VAGSDAEDRFIASLSTHAGFLRRHLETDAGGNHLVKNLKALAGLARRARVASARLVLTDSGGVQEEPPCSGSPA
jgi:UDP-N-acetylglucosamine 2-epimerase